MVVVVCIVCFTVAGPHYSNIPNMLTLISRFIFNRHDFARFINVFFSFISFYYLFFNLVIKTVPKCFVENLLLRDCVIGMYLSNVV